MAILSKAQILAVDDLPSEVVPVPEWGGEVIVRAMTGAEREHYTVMIATFNEKGEQTGISFGKVQATLAAMCVTDETGERLFTDADAESLGKKSGKALERVALAAKRLSGIGDEGAQAAKNG